MKATFQMLLLLLQEGKVTELQTKLEELILAKEATFKHDEDDIWTALGFPELREPALRTIDKLMQKIRDGANNSVIIENTYRSSDPEVIKLAVMYALGKAVGADTASTTYKVRNFLEKLDLAIKEAREKAEKNNPAPAAKS